MGQFYNGEYKKGAFFSLVRYVSIASLFVVIDGTCLPENGSDQLWQGVFIAGSLGLVGTVIWLPIDAYKSAERINHQQHQNSNQAQKLSTLRSPIAVKYSPYQGASISYSLHSRCCSDRACNCWAWSRG
jgi:hypothetical protein